jgi:hypothetical protein
MGRVRPTGSSSAGERSRCPEPFRSYLDPAFRYVFSQGPDRVRSRQDALSDGLNCVSLAHLIIRDLFGYVLPATYQCTELSTDAEHFASIPSASLMRPGDLVWFGVAGPAARVEDFVPRFEDGRLANFNEYPINHVAIYTGVREQGDYLLIHANPIDQTNTVWPLRAFQDHDRYGKVYAITRLRPQYARRNDSGRQVLVSRPEAGIAENAQRESARQSPQVPGP